MIQVWEAGMNPEQLQAIRHTEGPCKLLAVAGSGKTRALVHRIARMVADGIPPESILAVTFSTKAAEVMNERLDKLNVYGARVGTWHSLCLQILKQDFTRWADWEVDEKGRSRAVLKETLGYKHLDWPQGDLGKVSRVISLCKADLVRHDDAERVEEIAFDFGFGSYQCGRVQEAYATYQALIEERGILTFDDFLMFAYEHLRIDENRSKWSRKWDHLLVDEAQDNNLAQKTLQEMLAREHRNIMVVGDVAQAIYSFRGSDPKYLYGFEQEWGATSIVMHRNYRSGRRIVEAANAIIRPATIRLPVDMVAEKQTEGSVHVRECEDLDDEGETFAHWAMELAAGGSKLSDICVLFRTNAQSRAMEEALLKQSISYVVVGSANFYERKEVKDLLGYLRVAAKRDTDGDAVRRCINAPFRYLGTAFVERLKETEGEDWLERVREAADGAGIQDRQRQSAAEWVRIVKQAQKHVELGAAPANVLADIVHQTAYIAWLERDQGEESIDQSHAANVRELIRIAEKFSTVDELIDYIDDMVRQSKRRQRGDRVLLMSIHRAKGLEWPHVWVCGCNEKILPHHRGDLEEERRLLYVAATRAQDSLVFSYVKKFAQREGVRPAQPSRFLGESGLLDQVESRLSTLPVQGGLDL